MPSRFYKLPIECGGLYLELIRRVLAAQPMYAGMRVFSCAAMSTQLFWNAWPSWAESVPTVHAREMFMWLVGVPSKGVGPQQPAIQ